MHACVCVCALCRCPSNVTSRHSMQRQAASYSYGCVRGFEGFGVEPAFGHVALWSVTTPLQTEHMWLLIRLPDCLAGCRVPVWLLVGLGARGLVYHAWLGKLLAAAVLTDSEEQLPAELLAWRQHGTGGKAAQVPTEL